MFATTLALAVLGLLLGAALVLLGSKRVLASAAIDGLVLGFVPATLAFRMLPHAAESLGWWALVLALGASGALWWIDRRGHERDHAERHPFHPSAGAGAGLLLPVLALHGVGDGAALAVAVSPRSMGSSLALALILHRMPEGLFVASSVLPRSGPRKTAIALAALALSTLAGAVAGRALLDAVPDALFDGALALGVGVMLRLALHSHSARPTSRAEKALAGVAFLAGLALVFAMPDPAGLLRRALPQELSVTATLLPLFVEVAPAMLAGLALGAASEAWLAPRLRTALPSREAISLAARGLVEARGGGEGRDGLATARRLRRATEPVASVVAMLASTVALDGAALTVSVRLLGPAVALARFGIATVLAVAAGVFAARAASQMAASTASRPLLSAPSRRAPVTALRFGDALLRRLEGTSAPLLLGLAVAAATEATLPSGHLLDAGSYALACIAAAVVGGVAAPSALGAVPVAAVLVHKGLPPGAAVVLLLVGAAAGGGRAAFVSEAFGRRAGAAFVATVAASCAVAASAARAFPAGGWAPELHALAAHAHHPAELAAAALLGAAIAAAIVRAGPRAWIETLFTHAH